MQQEYCTLDRKDATTQRYWYRCNKVPFATIEIKVCGVNENEAKDLAEDVMRELTAPPQNNFMNICCKD